MRMKRKYSFVLSVFYSLLLINSIINSDHNRRPNPRLVDSEKRNQLSTGSALKKPFQENQLNGKFRYCFQIEDN